jgi:26S proteasome regulatory subunit N1
MSLGKGQLTISPVQQDRSVVSPVALLGILGVVHSALDFDRTIMDKYHYMLFAITASINPRMVLAVDKDLVPLEGGVQVRVGQPVDTVALPGKPKTITGFQTHHTPFLLDETDRAEIAPGKYRAIPNTIVEGVFIVEEKPGAD